MIDMKGMKPEPFLLRLALHLTGERRASYVASEGVWYLGAGYWRALVNLETRCVHLINPTRRSYDIAVIEDAMNLLL